MPAILPRLSSPRSAASGGPAGWWRSPRLGRPTADSPTDRPSRRPATRRQEESGPGRLARALVGWAVLAWVSGCATSGPRPPSASSASRTNHYITGTRIPVPSPASTPTMLSTRNYTQEEMQRWGGANLTDFLRRVPTLTLGRR